MRGTLHIVTPHDFWAFATARRALGAHYWPPSYERRLFGRLPRAVRAALAGEVERVEKFVA